VLLWRPANSRGTGWPLSVRPLTVAVTFRASTKRLKSACRPVADFSLGILTRKGSPRFSQDSEASTPSP